MSIHWSDLNKEGRIEAIKSVYEPGMSASEIAARIGGISRNAIIGMYGRHGEHLTDCGLRPFRTSGRSKKADAKPRRNAPRSFLKPVPVKREYVPEPQIAGRPLLLMQAHQCRWPVNDAEPGELHLFCSTPTAGGSYCEHHASRAFRALGIHGRRAGT